MHFIIFFVSLGWKLLNLTVIAVKKIRKTRHEFWHETRDSSPSNPNGDCRESTRTMRVAAWSVDDGRGNAWMEADVSRISRWTFRRFESGARSCVSTTVTTGVPSQTITGAHFCRLYRWKSAIQSPRPLVIPVGNCENENSRLTQPQPRLSRL